MTQYKSASFFQSAAGNPRRISLCATCAARTADVRIRLSLKEQEAVTPLNNANIAAELDSPHGIR